MTSIMKRIIESSRLYLRELDVTDATEFFKLNEDPDVLRYTGDEPFESLEAATHFLENYSEYEQNGFGRWTVIEKTSNSFIGWCGLKSHNSKWVDLGFRFHKREWGKGYGTESARAAVKAGFRQFQLEEIVGRAALANIASIRFLEKIGMKFWKREPCRGIENAVYYKIQNINKGK